MISSFAIGAPAALRLAVSAVALCALAAGSATAQKKTLVLGTDRVGSIVNFTGSTLGKIVSEHSPLTVRVRSYAGPEAWMPDMDSGRIDIGSHFAASFYLTRYQVGSKLKLRNLRLIRSSRGTSLLGFMVRKDSPIKTVNDLKGKRVTGSYGGQPIIRRMSQAVMKAHGFSYDDVTIVPVVAVVAGVRALTDGRADAAWASPMMPQAREAHAKVGIRFIPLPEVTPKQLKIIREHAFPSVYPQKFPGKMPYLPKGTQLLTQEMYVAVSDKLDGKTVRIVLDTLWAQEANIRKAHPALRGHLNKASVSAIPLIPYHPEAIAFYKEKGLWTEASQKAQDALLKEKM